MASRRVQGFTLIELLVVIAVIGVLVSLLLPAITACREASRRLQCENNIRQVVIALHTYSDARRGHMPWLTDATPKTPTGAHIQSFFYALLPHLEEDSLYNLYDDADPTSYYRDSATNPGLGSYPIKLFNCLSDTSDSGRDSYLTTNVVTPTPPPPYQSPFISRYASSNYAANALVFRTNRARFPKSFRDGTSHTIVLGERYRLCSGQPNEWAYGGNGNANPSFGFLPLAGGASTGMFAPDLPLRFDKTDLVYGKVGLDSAGPGTVVMQEAIQNNPFAGCDPRIPQALHPGVMNVAMGDGSVRCVASYITQKTFWEACTPAGGEISDWNW